MSRRLVEQDDYPMHQVSEPISRVGSPHPRWTERWYFNLQNKDGSLLAVIGGGQYPNTGVAETYTCVLVGHRQYNLVAHGPIDQMRGLNVDAGPRFAIEDPMKLWTIELSDRITMRLRYASANVPFLFAPFSVPARSVDDPADFDEIQHFVQPGLITGVVNVEGNTFTLEGAWSFRDRTWGIRSTRPKLHTWFVVHLEGGGYVTAIRQEHEDGVVMTSELAWVDRDGVTRRASIESHRFDFHPQTRLLRQGHLSGVDERGSKVSLEFENTGEGIRLAGAGYDSGQGGSRDTDRHLDVWDLSSPATIQKIGPSTIDSPIRVRFVVGGSARSGVGVSEAAVSAKHIRYGDQLGSK